MKDHIEDLPQSPEAVIERAPRPVVIVQYRRGLGSRLTTPLLVLIAALAVLSHRVKIDDWQGWFGSFPEPEPVADRPATPRPPVRLASPTTVVRTAFARATLNPPTDAPQPLALLPTPMRPSHPAIALPQPGQPGVETADAWQDIRRVSEMAKAEARDMEDLKARAQAQAQWFAAAQRIEAPRLQVRQAEMSRKNFLESLRNAVTRSDGHDAQVVEELCRKHGVWLVAERPAASTVSNPELTRTEVRYHIETLRTRGFTEVAILNDLVRLESRKRTARSGPKTHGEVVVRAARQLLAVQSSQRRVESE